MCELHDDLAEGDAFLHNDRIWATLITPTIPLSCRSLWKGDIYLPHVPKLTRPTAATAFLRPICLLRATSMRKAHSIFPVCGYSAITTTCRTLSGCAAGASEYRAWYGDYLAMLGAARIAERRLKLVAKYGVDLSGNCRRMVRLFGTADDQCDPANAER